MSTFASAQATRAENSSANLITIDRNAVVVEKAQATTTTTTTTTTTASQEGGEGAGKEKGKRPEDIKGEKEDERKDGADGGNGKGKAREEEGVWWRRESQPCCGRGCRCVLMVARGI
jgi:hypothetical protein